MDKKQPIKVLIAPLDWGLGHATRCIPIATTLYKAGADVLFAVNEKQKALLQQEFPYAAFIHLEGYNIQYAKNPLLFAIKIVVQIPKILSAIKKENLWLNEILKKEKIDIVISDNRYGLYNKKLPCIFITHQLSIHSPFGKRWLQKINYRFINRFSQCWVPDSEDKMGVAGMLSHPEKTPAIPTHYIGILSRFQNCNKQSFIYDICVLLSGPEPQRTVLENILVAQLSTVTDKRILFIRGLPNAKDEKQLMHVDFKNHLSQKELQEAICSSEFIVARSGYTTVMELLALKKKSILIPTPGQTEQEYLAKYLQERKKCISYQQDGLNILAAITQAQSYEYDLSAIDNYNETKILNLLNV